MNTILYMLILIAFVVGIGVSVWSFIDTRRLYFEEYKLRKNK